MADNGVVIGTGESGDLGPQVPLLYADKISTIEFGPGVSKLKLTVDGGREIAVIVLPTMGLIEIFENIYPQIKSSTGMRDVINKQLDLLKSKFGPP
jgi:hypothetical protein